MGRNRPQKLFTGWVIATALLAVGWLFAAASTTGPEWADVGTCEDCHADISESFLSTAHGTYFSGRGMPDAGPCQSCHGPGAAHVDSEDPADIFNPAKMDMIDSEATCLKCHDDYRWEEWSASIHRSNGIECSDCHQVHVGLGTRQYKRPTDRCYECHSEVKAATYMPSRHPIGEKKMECSTCHNVHGGEQPFMHEATAREACLQCHSQMEGPFIFEHPPVTENCLICHTPHGSVANSLLKQGEPSLCLSCHSMHFHAGIVGVDGAFDDPQAPERNGVSTPDAWKRGMLTKCTQCHTEIHGSDLPSQSISGQGSQMTR
jgi:DmsE family decaheme c-type cytochrome